MSQYDILCFYFLETVLYGYKIVGDNFDINFRRTFQRIDSQTISCHYFHMYAVQDRVDLGQKSDSQRDGIIDVPLLLPSNNDHDEMRKTFSILISRYGPIIYLIQSPINSYLSRANLVQLFGILIMYIPLK